MSLSEACLESYGVSGERRPEVDRNIFRSQGLMMELLQLGKWTNWNANFHMMINLQYEIVGTELSCPEAVRYCFILLVSYYQQSQSTPTAPHTQSPFYITFIRRCTNVENIWWQPSELCFLRGWKGLCWVRGPPAGPWCICSLVWTAVTPWGPLLFFSNTLTHPPIRDSSFNSCLYRCLRSSLKSLFKGPDSSVHS